MIVEREHGQFDAVVAAGGEKLVGAVFLVDVEPREVDIVRLFKRLFDRGHVRRGVRQPLDLVEPRLPFGQLCAVGQPDSPCEDEVVRHPDLFGELDHVADESAHFEIAIDLVPGALYELERLFERHLLAIAERRRQMTEVEQAVLAIDVHLDRVGAIYADVVKVEPRIPARAERASVCGDHIFLIPRCPGSRTYLSFRRRDALTAPPPLRSCDSRRCRRSRCTARSGRVCRG